MNIQKTLRAFTLIELLVGIAIISIMLLGTTQIDFNRLSAKQELEITTNKIKSNHEEIRNNALSGKGIGVNLVVPDAWKLEISKAGSGTIQNYYLSGSTRNEYQNDTIFKTGIQISKIECVSIDKTKDNFEIINNNSGSILYEGSNLTFTGASIGGCDIDDPSHHREIEITLENKKKDTRVLNINILNGLAEIVDK